jgi:hypothetical protein
MELIEIIIMIGVWVNVFIQGSWFYIDLTKNKKK